MGGGVVPVALHEGQYYLLFGREARGGGWSDFGGGKERNERPLETAIREGCEELCGFLGSKAKLSQRVRDHRIGHVRVAGFSAYLFEVPYDPLLPDYFRNHFLFVRSTRPEAVAKNGLYEKSDIAWFPLDSLRSQRHMFRPFYRRVVDSIIEKLSTARR